LVFFLIKARTCGLITIFFGGQELVELSYDSFLEDLCVVPPFPSTHANYTPSEPEMPPPEGSVVSWICPFPTALCPKFLPHASLSGLIINLLC